MPPTDTNDKPKPTLVKEYQATLDSMNDREETKSHITKSANQATDRLGSYEIAYDLKADVSDTKSNRSKLATILNKHDRD